MAIVCSYCSGYVARIMLGVREELGVKQVEDGSRLRTGPLGEVRKIRTRMGRRKGRKKEEVVDNDVAPERGFSLSMACCVHEGKCRDGDCEALDASDVDEDEDTDDGRGEKDDKKYEKDERDDDASMPTQRSEGENHKDRSVPMCSLVRRALHSHEPRRRRQY